jgi:hypothetical protein
MPGPQLTVPTVLGSADRAVTRRNKSYQCEQNGAYPNKVGKTVEKELQSATLTG